MSACGEIDHLTTPFVDGEVSPEQRAAVEAHLAVCPPCRSRAAAEAVARQAMRSRASHWCQPAPGTLKHRCRHTADSYSGTRSTRSRIVSFSMAAALVLLLGGILVYGLTASSSTVLAAQLALDHVKCFGLFGGQEAIEPIDAEQQFAKDYGWAVKVPRGTSSEGPAGLQLVGARRCLYAEGTIAHLMYRLEGRPLSLFMLPSTTRPRGVTSALGHDAVIWSGGDKTYVLMGREPRIELEKVAAYLGQGLK